MDIENRMPAQVISDLFGGLTKWANAYNPPKTLSTVQRWLESGYVPARQQKPTLDAAKAARVKLPPNVFIPTDAALQARRQAA